MRQLRLTVAATILVSGCATAPTAATTSVPALRFLLINDVYFGDTLRDGTAGLARVAALRDSLARTGPVTFVLAGDFLSPSLLSKWHRGVQMIEQLNAARLDFATFGNHEFELDRDTLIARIAESRFKWTSANCMAATADPFPRVSKWDTLTVSGTRIGMFGVTLTGDYRRYVKCGNADSAARASINALQAAGAQLIIGLTHQSLTADSALLAREPALDLILGGHEHEFHRILIGGKRLVKADANSRSAQLVMVSRGPSGWNQSDELIAIDGRIAMDRPTADVVKRWQDSLIKRLGPERVIATTSFPLDGRDASNRARESPLGDVVTDAIRLGTGADVAVINAGTMRIDDVIPAGPITNYQLESIFLFPDESRIMTFPITGARLKEIVERGVSETAVGRGAYLQVSGLKYRWDASRPSGSRIIGDVALSNGRVLKPGDVVRLSFNVYPACEGGDGYIVPEAKAACEVRDKAPRAVDLVMSHITTRLGGKVTEPEAGRVTRM
ncbi:MAG: bifunctional metallophosphatase/5'-nucleotidase [Gemmatimonadota bacterium]|nr:bifunctional metallophosphatase/5'-nucleotidase [Gemmatimonadota bacterium]